MAGSFVFRRSSLAVITAMGVLCAATASIAAQSSGQNSPPQSGTHTSPESVHHAHSSKHVSPKAEPVAEPALPPPPPKPHWPVDDPAKSASVNWDGRDLTIKATNSSLQQILTDISTATGVKVDGQNGDQRIFGSYGPAPARDVLGQLLQGSGYNVLMIGDRGEGTPRQLVLTAKTQSAATSSRGGGQANSNSDDDVQEEPEPPEQPEPQQRRPPGIPPQPGAPGRFPPDLQQRQQQLEQQQQLQQQQQPQPNPPQTPQ